MKKKDFDKIFVLDTNVILHDSQCLYKFQDNLVVVPMCVLEELDRFKKGQDETARHSRQFSRYMDKLRMRGDLKKGVSLKTGGFLKVRTEDELETPEGMADIPDNRIIASALMEQSENSRKKVIVVSKDINLRVKATILGIKAEDYSNDKINFDEMYTGVLVHEIFEPIVPDLYTFKEIDPEDIPDLPKMYPNQYLVIKYGKQKGLARYDAEMNKLVSLRGADKEGIWGIQPKNLEQTLALDMLLNNDIKLVSLIGKAGTGKTLLSVAAGMHKTLTHQDFKKVVISRPIVPMGKDLGYLPGDLNEKLNPWMKPIFDNVDFLLNGHNTTKTGYCVSGNELLEQGMMEVEPLTYIRGRSIPQQYLLIDEAQNLTPHEIKTIITRAGEGTKIILTGDCHQIDNPFLDASSNGLSYVVERFKKENIAAHITLLKGERSELAEIASNVL